MSLGEIRDVVTKAMQETRANYHVTLGEMIDKLEGLPQDAPITFDFNSEYVGHGYSYRGYYEDFALDSKEEPRSVGHLLSVCKGAVGRKYQGWKGGYYRMHRNTPLWAAEQGQTGRAIMGLGVSRGGTTWQLVTKEIPE